MDFQYTAGLLTLADFPGEILVKFYAQLLDQNPLFYRPNSYAEFQLPGLRIGIFQPKASQQAEFAHQAKTGISLCLEVTDLMAAITRLQALGYPPSGEILNASHGREIYAFDPAGNRIILYQPYP